MANECGSFSRTIKKLKVQTKSRDSKILNLTRSSFPTAKSDILIHPPPLIRALRRLRAKTRGNSENFKLQQFVPTRKIPKQIPIFTH